MLVFHQQTAGKHDNIRVFNKSLKNMVKFKYLGTVVTHQNCIQEEIESTLNMENAYYHAVPYLFSFQLLSKHVKIKIQRTIIAAVVLSGCERWSLTLRKNTVRVSENMGEENM
jgi:hypothetical protein